MSIDSNILAIMKRMTAVQTGTRTYTPLTLAAVPAYLASVPAAMEILGGSADLDCIEVGDGNLNLVFLVNVKDNPGKTAVVKQALPYLRCAGDSWPLGRERMEFESLALAIQAVICPDLTPALYHYDRDMSLIVMENLNKHVTMRKGLVKGVKYPQFAGDIARFLARTLFLTSDLHLPSAEKKEMVEFFTRNTQLCKITEDFVFTNPYMDSPDNRWNPEIDADVRRIHADARLKCGIAALKDDFLARTQSLVHGDLHTGSVMLNQEETRVIDPEFAFYGPMGFDIGAVLGNLVLAYCSHEIHSPDPEARADYQGWLLAVIVDTWTGFAQEFLRLWHDENNGEATRPAFFAACGGEAALDMYRREYLRRVLQDSVGYAGCKMMRRQIGIAHVYDIECIEDPKKRAVAERLALAIGTRFVREREWIITIDDLISVIRSTKP